MKYSIRGLIKTSDDLGIIQLINQFLIYRLDPKKTKDENGIDILTFEAWLPNVTDKNNLYAELKAKVSILGGEINWHECTHDEENPQPCVIVESYLGD